MGLLVHLGMGEGDDEMTKMKEERWADLPRMSKLAAAMYPDKIPSHIQRGMLAANPSEALRSRMGHVEQAEPVVAGRYPSKVPYSVENLDRIPTLRRK